MKRPLIYSALLHFTVLILLLVGFYNPFERVRSKEAPMMIEFVQISELSAAPILAPESIKEPEQPQPPTPTPPPPPQPEPPQPEPPQPAPEPQPEPEPVKPEPKPEPTPQPKPEEAEPIPDPKAKKKPKEKEKPKEEKKKQKAEITLDKKKKSSKPSKSLEDIMNEALNEQESDKTDDAPSKGRGAPAETIGPILTASEIGALGQHFSKCWLIPAGLRDARNIVVKIDISFDKEGIINKAEIVEKGRVAQDSAYRTAAESARRAVLDPNCSQLPLPAEKLDKFKKEGLRFNFDPKAMF